MLKKMKAIVFLVWLCWFWFFFFYKKSWIVRYDRKNLHEWILSLSPASPKQMKENAESLKTLNEQLQSKEVELLQLRTEVETQQGIHLDTSA